MTGCCTKRAAAGFVEKLPQSKPDGFASSLGEGASGETRKFAIKPETFPLRQRPPPQAHYVRQLPQGDAFALCRKLYRYRQKPSPWGRWLDAKRQDGRGIPQLPFAVTTPPVKMQCRTARRLSGIALFKIIFPLWMRRAQRSAFKIVHLPIKRKIPGGCYIAAPGIFSGFT